MRKKRKVHDKVSSRPADRPDPHLVWTAPAETDAHGGSTDDPDHIPRSPLSRRRRYCRRRYFRRRYFRRRYCRRYFHRRRYYHRRRHHLPPLKVDGNEK
jgi:hypothetical protein